MTTNQAMSAPVLELVVSKLREGTVRDELLVTEPAMTEGIGEQARFVGYGLLRSQSPPGGAPRIE